MRIDRDISVFGVAGFLALATAGLALAQDNAIQAAPIPPEAAVAVEAVKPLSVDYYNFEKVRPIGSPGIDSMDIANNFVAGRTPDATVVLPAGVINCPPDQGTLSPRGQALGAYLFGSLEMEKRRLAAKQGSGPEVPAELETQMSSRNIWVFKGFIRVDKEGTYDFRIPCDDAARLTIGGILAHTSPEGGMYEATAPQYLSRAEFMVPGIYPVEVLHYDKSGQTGIKAYSTLQTAGGTGLTLLQFLGETPKEAATKPEAGKPEEKAEAAAPAEKTPIRTWVSLQGRRMEARLAGREGNTVILEKADGSKVKTQVQRLSKEDQEYLQDLEK